MSDTLANVLPYRVELNKPIKKKCLDTLFATGDHEAHRFDIELVRNGEPVSIPGAGVHGYFIKHSSNPDEEDSMVVLEGSAEGNVASIKLDKACYVKTCQFSFIIKVTIGEEITSVFWGDGTVMRSKSDTIEDPTHVVPDLDTLLAQIAAMKAATAEGTAAAIEARSAGEEARATAQEAADTALEAAKNADAARLAIRDDLNTKAPAIECESSGAIVTVKDAAVMPVMQLVSNIAPVRNTAAGMDIKGYDEVMVQRTGKNLFPSGKETFTQRKRVIFDTSLPAGVYTIGALIASDDTDGITSTISFLDEELKTVASATLNRSAYNRKTITINREVYSAQMYAGVNLAQSNGDAATWSNIMLTAGSTEYDYEPYAGQTLTANLPETVYVGTIDWTNGLLTVESYGLAEFNGSEAFETPSSENTKTQIFTCAEVKVDNKAKWSTNYAKSVSNLFSASAFTTPSYAKLEANTFYWADASGAWRFGWGQPGATAEDFKAFLQSSPLKILVPTTAGTKEYQLTLQQLDMLKGYNNVISASGDTSIVYVADTKMYIDSKISELVTLALANQ